MEDGMSEVLPQVYNNPPSHSATPPVDSSPKVVFNHPSSLLPQVYNTPPPHSGKPPVDSSPQVVFNHPSSQLPQVYNTPPSHSATPPVDSPLQTVFNLPSSQLPQVYNTPPSHSGMPPVESTPQVFNYPPSQPPQNTYQVSQQPLPQVPMKLTPHPGGNKNANNMPIGQDGQRDWSTGLFSCFDHPDKAVIACCCPCIAYSQNKHRYIYLVDQGAADPKRGGSGLDINCILYVVMNSFCLNWLLQINMTSLVRQRYSIRGSPMQDVLTAACCVPCDFVRQSRELEYEEQSLGQQRIY